MNIHHATEAMRPQQARGCSVLAKLSFFLASAAMLAMINTTHAAGTSDFITSTSFGPPLSVKITSPASGAELKPGQSIKAAIVGNVNRVEFSLISTGYSTSLENYLGATTGSPLQSSYAFTWNGPASAIVYGGYNGYRLIARAFTSTNRTVTHEIPVVVRGTFGGPDATRAINTTGESAAQGALLGGARLLTEAQNGAVGQLVELNAAGDGVEVVIDAPTDGIYEISVNQKRLTGAKPAISVKVNDADEKFTLFPLRSVTNVNEFGRRAASTIATRLNAGANTIRITSTENGRLTLSDVLAAQPPVAR